MSSTFTPAELLHYSRHVNLAEIGLAGQQRLKQARVLCVGAGGLGSACLFYLAAAGIGVLGIIDDDVVEASNLQRQVLYSYADIGLKKINVARTRLQALNPAIEITLHDTQLTDANVFEIFTQYDVIVDGSDNFATRYRVNDACFQLKKPFVYASISRFEGQCSVFDLSRREQEAVFPCLRCLFEEPPATGLIFNCSEGGVLGVLPGIMGTIQATEVIKLILGIGEPLIGRLLLFNALKMSAHEIKIRPNPECRLCRYQQQFNDLRYYESGGCMSGPRNISEVSVIELDDLRQDGSDFVLLDVREPSEYEICNLQGKLIPLKELQDRIAELDPNQHIIIHCKHGGRSQQAAKLLTDRGFNKVSNLTGGIMAWIDKIDPTLLRY